MLQQDLSVGDAVHFYGASQSPAPGFTLEHGAWGEVTGPAPADSDKLVAVRFPGSSGQLFCYLTTLCRAWPPPVPDR